MSEISESTLLFGPFNEPSANTSLDRLYEQIAREQCEKESLAAVIVRAEVELMRWPVSTATSFRTLGLLLGIFPPAAIFWEFARYGSVYFGCGTHPPGINTRGVLFCVGMNLVCAVVGWLMGGVLTRILGKRGQNSWIKMVLLLPLLAALWGTITGAAGGAVLYGVGALFGPIFAIPVALLGFTAFGLAHHSLQRDGMIRTSHLLPLAVGITATISAFILGLPF